MTKIALTLAACTALLFVGTAQASPTAAQKCQAAKNVAAGKYAACRHNAEKGLALTGDSLKYDAAITKCEETFAKAWQAAIDKATSAGATCPDAPLVANDYKPVIDDHTDTIAKALRGDGLCGNGIIESGEDCEFGNLGGQTCNTATGGASPFGTLACGRGCVFNTSGCFACPGATVGGFCWVLSAQGGSCRTACANVGHTYDFATADYAGSGGSDDNCRDVVNALFNNPFGGLIYAGGGPSGIGCTAFGFNPVQYRRNTNATAPDQTDPSLYRACACH